MAVHYSTSTPVRKHFVDKCRSREAENAARIRRRPLHYDQVRPPPVTTTRLTIPRALHLADLITELNGPHSNPPLQPLPTG